MTLLCLGFLFILLCVVLESRLSKVNPLLHSEHVLVVVAQEKVVVLYSVVIRGRVGVELVFDHWNDRRLTDVAVELEAVPVLLVRVEQATQNVLETGSVLEVDSGKHVLVLVP